MRSLSNGGGFLLDATIDQYDGWREQGSHSKLNLFTKLETPISARPDFTVYLNYLDAVKDTPNGILLNNNGNLLPVAGGRKSFLGFGSPEGDQQLLLGTLKVDHVISSSLSLSAALQLRHNERENNLNFYDSFGFSPERNVNAKACALCIWFVCEQILSQCFVLVWFGISTNYRQDLEEDLTASGH
jgi:hypothetical protein